MKSKTHQPPQEFIKGTLMQEYLRLNPLTVAQVEQNRVDLLKMVLGARPWMIQAILILFAFIGRS